MKKIFLFSLILVLMSAAASAQSISANRSHKGQLSRIEKKELRRDMARNHIINRRAHRDGVVTPMERRRLRRSKCDTRRDSFRFRHNSRRRLI